MPKRIGYLAAALVILLALIGPVVYKQEISSTGQRGAGNVLTPTQAPLPAGNLAAGSPAENTQTPTAITTGKNTGDNGVTAGGKTAAADDSSSVTASPPKIGGQDASGAAPPAAPGSDHAGSENNIQAPSAAGGCQVDIAIVGMRGQNLFGPAAVTVNKNNKWGLTALGALEATGLKYSMSPVYGNFVQSIAGQANKGMCGWMYKVNNETPMVAASEKKVNPGDKIIWWYSESMNNPGPTWEGLKAASP